LFPTLHLNYLQWDNVTEAAKAMIGDMLAMDPEQRAPAQTLLQHRWFLSDGPAAAPAAALGAHMVRRLRAFANMNHMKRLALVVLARTLTDKDVNRLRVSFWGKDVCTVACGFDCLGAGIASSVIQWFHARLHCPCINRAVDDVFC
jgi:hypothetical protein